MQLIDAEQRELILSSEGNIVVSASAGTGKTRSTIERIKADQKKNNNYQTFAAITFTKKATKEIMDRLGRDRGDGYVGTNDKFVLTEVIQPFMYDVYGRKFKKQFKPDYSNDNSFETFDEGISLIDKRGIIAKYEDQHMNFAFQLGLKILQESFAARRYLKSKYYRIYIDEYQDSDKDMHEFFMYICKKLDIKMFIVGDAKQSIYRWRGGHVEGFKEIIKDTDFNSFKLIHNFRSNIQIQNYANIFMDDVRSYFKLEPVDNKVIVLLYNDAQNCIDFIKEELDLTKKSAILVRRNDDAQEFSDLLKANDMEFIYLPISELDKTENESEHIWIAREIASFILTERYSEYNVMEEIPDPEGFELRVIRDLLADIKGSCEDLEEFLTSCIALYEYMGFEHSKKTESEIKLLFEVVNDDKFLMTYNPGKYNNVVGTIFSAKGLQYKQVVIMASDYNLSREDDRNLHYVAVTRPEEKLIILVDKNNKYNKYYLSELSRCIDETRRIKGHMEFSDVANLISV